MLSTLTPRDFLAGYGEVVKYGMLGDADFFAWLEAHGPALAAGDSTARVEAVARSVQMKADIVVRDETEQGDRFLVCSDGLTKYATFGMLEKARLIITIR